MFQTVNPATELVLQTYAFDSDVMLREKLDRSAAAFADWRRASFEDRATLMHTAAHLLRSRSRALAVLITAEMGKPVAQSRAEIEKCADACEFFADGAAEMLADLPVESDATRSEIRYDPLGGVLAVMPWNFPFWQVFRFAAPALMAGNVALLKHAPNTAGCAAAIEKLFADAGFPPGVFVNLVIDTPAVAAVIADPAVAAVTLTGGAEAGRAVAAAAGAGLKKCVLELGGSDPFLVLADADIPAAATAAAAARCVNSGQSCIAAKRFIVEAAVADEFEAMFALAMADLRVGDPTKAKTSVGPLARRDLLVNLERQVADSVAAGARVVVGGHHRSPGYYFAPAVLADVRPGMAVFDEETFGPVAAVVTAVDGHDLIRLANATVFGLGASIWTRDVERAHRVAARLDVGSVFVNGPVKSDPRLPFGGIKQSGHGRELSAVGIREFTNVKTIWVK